MLSNRQLRAALTRGAWIIATLALVTATCAAALSVRLPERYVASQELAVVSPLISASGVVPRDTNQTRLLSTTAALLVSDSVLQRAADGSNSTASDLQERVSVSTDANSDLVTVSITSANAARAEQELEAIVSSAQQTELGAERARLEAALAGIEQELVSAAEASTTGGSTNRDALETVRANVSAALASLTSSMQPVADVTIRDAASKLSPLMAVAIGAVAGGLLGAAVVVLRTRFRARLLGPEDVRAMGLPVLAGPDEPLHRAAQRISNLWRTAPTPASQLLLVHVGRGTAVLQDALVALWQRSDEPLRVVLVEEDGRATGGGRGGERPGLSFVRLSEDDVFSSAYTQALYSAPESWTLVSVAGSDQVVVRAGAQIGSALLIAREGEPTSSLARLATALNDSAVEVAGVVMVGRRAERKRQGRSGAPAPAGRR